MAARAFDVCLFLCRGSGAQLRDLCLAFESVSRGDLPWAASGKGNENVKWRVLEGLVVAQDVETNEDASISGLHSASAAGSAAGEECPADIWQGIDRMQLLGLEAEALGHKGHALYRQRQQVHGAIKLITGAIQLASQVLASLLSILPSARACKVRRSGQRALELVQTVQRDVAATRIIALGTLGDIYLALGSVLQVYIV